MFGIVNDDKVWKQSFLLDLFYKYQDERCNAKCTA